MHPEFLSEMTDQRVHERRAQADQARLARLAIRAGRRRHHASYEADGYVVPRIPDYVDGSFRAEPAGTELASETGQAPATHRAA